MATTDHGNLNHSHKTLVELNDAIAHELVPAMIYVGILMVLGVLGNLVVCFIFTFRLRMGTQHFLIVCLAVFDLLSCFIAMPTEIVDMRFFLMFKDEFACRLLRFVNSYCAFASILTLVVIAVDRFRKVCHPLKRQMTLRHVKMALVAVLLVALVFALPAAVLYGIRTTETAEPDIYGHDCSTNDQVKDTLFPLVYNSVLFIAFLILLVTLSVLYFRIWREMKRHSRYMARNSDAASISVKGFSQTESSSGSGGHHRVSFDQSSPRSDAESNNASFFPAGSQSSDDVPTEQNTRRSGGCVGAARTSWSDTYRQTSANADEDSNYSGGSQITYCETEHGNGTHHAVQSVSGDDKDDVRHQGTHVERETGDRQLGESSVDSDVFLPTENGDVNQHQLDPDTHTLSSDLHPQAEDTENNPTVAQSSSNLRAESESAEDHSSHTTEDHSPHTYQSGGNVQCDDDCTKDSLRENGPSLCDSRCECEEHLHETVVRKNHTCKHCTPDCSIGKSARAEEHRASNGSCSSVQEGGHEDKPRVKSVSLSVSEVKNTKATIIAFSVTVVFFLSFVPHLSLITARIIREDFDRTLRGAALVLYNIFLRSYFVNSASNPIIYGVLNTRFRAECWRLLREL
ncbi:hypothetical protein BaRGS_00030113, partial [Batillaria attramentaria]